MAGWSDALSSSGIVEEHRTPGRPARFFDVPHMGRPARGPDAEAALQGVRATPPTWGAGCVLATRTSAGVTGGIPDDVIGLRVSGELPGRLQRGQPREDRGWLRKHAEGAATSSSIDRTESTAMVAIQGQQAIPSSSAVPQHHAERPEAAASLLKGEVATTFRFSVFRLDSRHEDLARRRHLRRSTRPFSAMLLTGLSGIRVRSDRLASWPGADWRA
ncbi:MAG: hypothetical protein H6816_08880 [Phycisphaerales bacterium]|nr:hypothetical protein [Phycisphaerales bacterium]